MFHVLQHRGLVCAHRLGASQALGQRDLELHPQRLGHGLGLAHHPFGQRPGRRMAADVLQRGMGQRRNRVEAQIAPQLDPQLGPDIARNGGFEAGPHESRRQRLDARAAAAIGLTQREAVALDHPHQARLNQLSGRVDHTADDAFGLNVLGQHAVGINADDRAPFIRPGQLVKVPPRHAVDHRDDHRIGPEQGPHRRQQVAHLVGLDRQQHHVLRPGIGHLRHRPDSRCMQAAAILQDQPEPVAVDRREVAVAGDEGDRLTRR